MTFGDGPMGIFLVFATNDLRARIATTCSSFYMPSEHVAVVSYNGNAEDLARRLNVDQMGGPGALAHCLSSRRVLAVLGGLLAVVSAYELLI